MADQLPIAASTSAPSALGREARYVALNRSHAELHSVALAPDHALGSQLDSDAVDFGCVRENVIHAARDGQHEMVAIVETAQGSMKATSGHRPGAGEDVLHCTAECGTSSASSVAADQLLTAAMEDRSLMQPEQLRAFARSILDRKLRAGWRREQILGIEYEGFTGPAHAGYLISAGKISVCQENQYLIRHTDAWAVTFRIADLLRDEPEPPPVLPAQLDLFA